MKLEPLEEDTPGQPADQAFPTSTSPAERILLVEDHTMNQIVLKTTLGKKWPALVIRVASNGMEAQEWLSTEKFDLILMDIQLPDTDGYALTEQLRTAVGSLNKNTPVLAMTAQTQITADERYLKAGMNDYVLKPFDPQNLFQKITQHSRHKPT